MLLTATREMSLLSVGSITPRDTTFVLVLIAWDEKHKRTSAYPQQQPDVRPHKDEEKAVKNNKKKG